VVDKRRYGKLDLASSVRTAETGRPPMKTRRELHTSAHKIPTRSKSEHRRHTEKLGLWSGRGDLNARPPAPEAVFGMPRKAPVFKCLGFKQLG